jgi:glycopeptide antibiotics resistance protein
MKKRKPPRSHRGAIAVVSVAYLAVVGALTLGPQPTDAITRRLSTDIIFRVNEFGPGLNFRYSDLEFAANIAMFVPLGLLFVLAFGRSRWWAAVLVGAAFTLLIEGAQRYIPDRVSDPRDVLANITGAAVGAVITLVATGLTARRSASRRSAGRRAPA